MSVSTADAILEGKLQVAAEAQVKAEGADVSGDAETGEGKAKAGPKPRATAKKAMPKPPKV